MEPNNPVEPSGFTEPPTNGRVSPLDEVHRAAGASFTDFAGWLMPVRYSSDLVEHHAVRTAAGIFDLSHMGELVVEGPEAAATLDGALAGLLSALEIGQAKYSLILDPRGGIIDDLVVYRTGPDRFLIIANASNVGTVESELRARAGGSAVTITNESDRTALIAVQGPLTLSIVCETVGFSIASTDTRADLKALKYYRCIAGTFRGEPILIARTGYTGEDGFELYTAAESAPALWRALIEVGAPRGLVPAGLASRDTLRLEAGMPLYGHELSRDILPVQAGLGRVVALDKESFIGKDAIAKGPATDAPVLVGLRGEGRRAARATYSVYASNSPDAPPIGVITSGALSPTLGYPIAMAYLNPAYSAPGTEVHVDIRGTRLVTSVVPLPFYRRPS